MSWMLFSHTLMGNCNSTALHILVTNSYEFVQTHLYVFIQSACTSLREWILMQKFSQLKPSKFITNMPNMPLKYLCFLIEIGLCFTCNYYKWGLKCSSCKKDTNHYNNISKYIIKIESCSIFQVF